MAGRVDQVEDVVLPVLGRVVQPDGLRLDGDAALALEVHRVEHLLVHLARVEPAGHLDQAVGQRGLPVVDVRDDREVADTGKFGHSGKAILGPDSGSASGARSTFFWLNVHDP